jgi:hypothetical protein
MSEQYTRGPPRDAEELLRRYASGERHFEGSDLMGADLAGANLHRVSLRGANLAGANLTGANLVDTDLAYVELFGANFEGANLEGTNLGRSNLGGANLTDASLTRANLGGADLSGTKLVRANLVQTKLFSTLFDGTNLKDADFGDAKLGRTTFTGIDLYPFSETLRPALHMAPSTIDFLTIVFSLSSPNLKEFLQRAGMPEIFSEYMVDCARSLRMDVFKMLKSTFISFGSPDEPFARKLYEALHRNGATTFFFPEHALPGEKLHRMMRKGVNEHDRVILVCSQASLDRKGVMTEIEETLAREARDGGASYLIPIRLDGYVFTGWKPPNEDVAQAVRDRVVTDFEGADTDGAKFDAGLRRVIAALKK